MLNVIKHLLPRGRATDITTEKPLRRFFRALSDSFDDVRLTLDKTYTDIRPQDTRQLGDYEIEYALPDAGLTEQQRRDRLAASLSATGGLGLDNLQGVLQSRGFNVYVHNWWVPGTESNPTIRDPAIIISNAQARRSRVDAGEALAQAGETFVVPPPPLGFLLVNIIRTDSGVIEYTVPTDPAAFPHVIYIGGEVFGEYAEVPNARRAEFEELCLRLRPAHKWLGMLITYN